MPSTARIAPGGMLYHVINRGMCKNDSFFQDDSANECLDRIKEDMEIIENFDYYKCCLFYKGMMALDKLENDGAEAQYRDAVEYAIGNWQFYNGKTEKSCARFAELTSQGMWNSFAYIAAESDLASAYKIP